MFCYPGLQNSPGQNVGRCTSHYGGKCIELLELILLCLSDYKHYKLSIWRGPSDEIKTNKLHPACPPHVYYCLGPIEGDIIGVITCNGSNHPSYN